ncbi:putative disease resistance protein RGA3 [Syzygium oleosum]|uniref:putative disease resistance protein RGA3 n=1 Tax=Syzygium oleosum TaxID=219896 RepID=UPI0024B8FAC3|nr:putative disease resistance protein RGA3 [Syzygium oleosum]
MAEAVLGSIAGEIVANLVPRALEDVRNLWDVKHEPEVLRDTLLLCKLGELNGLDNIRGSLSIENLGHVIEVAEFKAANLIGKHSLESLELQWGCLDTDDAVIGDKDEALVDGLRPPSNLQSLTIDGYKDHSSTLTTPFSSLLRLWIGYCENLKLMPLATHLEELTLSKVNPKLINQIFGLNKLKSLYILEMEFLECLREECLQSLTSLEFLGNYHCPRLACLSLSMQYLSNLAHLSFQYREKLDLSKDKSDNILDLQGLESLLSMDILDVPKLASLPQWLLQVRNLEWLSIKKCLNLKALPEQIETLQSLQPLEIIRCPSLTSLPKAMRRLTMLIHLKIAGCPDLEERCKKEAVEDWYKIAHIPHITHKLEYYYEHYL